MTACSPKRSPMRSSAASKARCGLSVAQAAERGGRFADHWRLVAIDQRDQLFDRGRIAMQAGRARRRPDARRAGRRRAQRAPFRGGRIVDTRERHTAAHLVSTAQQAARRPAAGSTAGRLPPGARQRDRERPAAQSASSAVSSAGASDGQAIFCPRGSAAVWLARRTR